MQTQYPFIYGLTESGFDQRVVLETDHPQIAL